MPADEMMATVTRPIEEAMKDIPGALTVRSATKRGSAQINVFFNWQRGHGAVGIVCAGAALANPQRPAGDGLHGGGARDVLGLSHHRHQPDQFQSQTSYRFGKRRNYELKPRFLQIPGVARVEITGGREPEYHVIVDPLKLQAAGLGLSEVSDALDEKQSLRARRHDGGKLSSLPDDGGRARAFGGGH